MEVLKLDFEKILEGVKGAEGPVFTPQGQFYIVEPELMDGDKYAGNIRLVDLEKKGSRVICAPEIKGCGGIPAGCQSLRDGALYVADMRLGILLVQSDGSFEQCVTEDSEERTMQGCNDCALDYTGSLWVTGPAGEIAPHPYRRSFEEAFGSVYCYLPDEKKAVRIDTGLNFPNGIAVQHDASGKPAVLIVAETPLKRLWAYDILGPGQVANKREWGKLPGDHEGGPDGMDFDAEGNLLVANWGSGHLEVFSPSGGTPSYRIACPFKNPSNLHFRPGTCEVFVTEHEYHGLWRFTWKHPGMEQFCDRV